MTLRNSLFAIWLSMFAFIPACPGCSEVKTVFNNCGLPAVAKLVSQILPQVVAALVSNDYSKLISEIMLTMQQQGINDALGVITCAVQTVDVNVMHYSTDPNTNAMNLHAKAWLLAHR